MAHVDLRIEDLILDHNNPRISHSEAQREALQKIVRDQKTKLVKLAESIVDRGLNPMDRLLVLRLNQKPQKFIALEGNRRIAVFKMLTNPAVMTGLEIPDAVQRAFERLSKRFKKSLIEPIPCYELASREQGRYWLNLRHNVGHEGAGIDGWKSLAKRRFEGKPPAVQVLELVTDRAGLTPTERAAITEKFPTTTLERFLENRSVRKQLGFDVKDGKLVTKLPADEVAKPLKKIVLDLATKKARVGMLMKTNDMLDYINTLGDAHKPDLSKARKVERTFDEIPTSEFTKIGNSNGRRKRDASDRKEVVQKGCPIRVTDNRIAEIYKELRTLKLDGAPNAIAVLLRVFLELSVDRFLETSGSGPSYSAPNGNTVHKKLEKKLTEVVDILVSNGVPERHFNNVKRDLSNQNSPMNVDLFHRYVHDRFATPTPVDLKAAWDHAQPLFEKIWP